MPVSKLYHRTFFVIDLVGVCWRVVSKWKHLSNFGLVSLNRHCPLNSTLIWRLRFPGVLHLLASGAWGCGLWPVQGTLHCRGAEWTICAPGLHPSVADGENVNSLSFMGYRACRWWVKHLHSYRHHGSFFEFSFVVAFSCRQATPISGVFRSSLRKR